MIFKKLEKYLKNIDGKIAIYDIGKETEKNIPEINEYVEIVGLLDGFRDNGNIYGYNIISLNKAIKIGIKAIIVIARPGSCRAIVTRIKDKCNENNIKIYDVYGNNLLEEKQSKCTLGKLKPYYKKDLMNKIEEADVISFDCFNTLITRQLFSRYDLFELLYNKLSLTEMSLKEFVNQRIKSEKSTAIGLAPNLKKIYEDCVFFSGIDFAEEEFKIDKSVIIRREELVEVLNYCINKGKEAIVVTDTYYSEKQIKSILNDNSIYGIKKIYASSEYTRGKDTGLFDIVKKDYPKKKILHIGDDYLSDYKSAIKSGINSYKIYSCEDLFYGTNFMPDVEPDMELDSKIKIGLFISNIFNNPFVFERLEKDICIQNNKTIGYSFCAPLIMDFVKWFEEKTRECNDCQIWLSARDGYLIKKIYEILYPNRKTHYVLTSRTAAIRAGTLSEDDIAYVDDMKFGGNMDLCLKKRFGIDVNKIDIKQIDDTQQGILKYKEIIIGEAWKKYLNYKKYLKKICEKNKNILFFDFVAKGTCQFFIKKMVPNKIKGLYFLQLEPQYMNDKQIQIESFFSEREKIKSTIYQDYYILETILTSFSPSVNEFNISGEPIYAEETRLKEDLDCIYEVQSGILNYIKDFIKIYPIEQLKINKKLDEQILSAIHNVNLNDCYFSKLKVEDPFFNRMTDIKQVL